MKRTKSIWMRLLVTVISVAMMLGCFGGLALAEPFDNAGVLHESGYIPTKVTLSEEFKLPAAVEGGEVTVTAPNGKSAKAKSANTYVASALGNYTVTYKKGDLSYSYIINCIEEDEFFIYVADGGAAIPSYIAKGGSFTLPEWYLAKYDEDGNIVKVDNSVTTWSLNNEAPSGVAPNQVAISNSGTQLLRLSAKLSGDSEESGKEYSKDFTIISQSNFEDKKGPTLRNISNMPSTASINTKVTLPKASAEDDYDSNVTINVTVQDPNGNDVKEVNLENDYAVSEKDTTVKFDNDKVVDFYPTKNGTYVVTYVATDDAGNKSSPHTYKITVSDKTGPVIIDSEDDKVPTVWGLKSVDTGNGLLGSNVVNIPIPEVADNVDKFILDDTDAPFTGNVKMTIEIKNPNTTVARFNQITPADIKGQPVIDATNSNYKNYFKNADGDKKYEVKIVTPGSRPYLMLDFNAFSDSDEDSKINAAVTGTWTVTFSFRDSVNNGGYNNSQKVYTINVSDNVLLDDEAPVIEEPTFPDYLIVGNDVDSYTVPSIVVKDNKDANLTIDYAIVNGFEDDAESLEVKGGETLDIIENSDGYFFKNADGKTLKLEDDKKIYFKYTATDDVGNKAELLKDEDAESNEDKYYSIDVFAAKAGYDVEDGLEFNFGEVEPLDKPEEVTLGSFNVKLASRPEFVGYELSVLDGKGNSLDNVSAYMFYAGGEEKTLYVKEIKFTPAKTDNYVLNVRIFDAKGNSFVYVKKFEITVKDKYVEVGAATAASEWDSSTANTGKSYMLQRKPFTVEGDSAETYVRAFKIVGNKYRVLGYEFTPLMQGNYSVTEYYGKEADVVGAGSLSNALTKNGASYGMSVADSFATKFEIQGSIPAYSPKYDTPDNPNEYVDGKYFVTDPIVAYSDMKSYDVTVKYHHSSSSAISAEKVYEYTGDVEDAPKYAFKRYVDSSEYKNDYGFYGRFALILDKDGTYTVTVSAEGTADNAQPKEYTIKVGDIEAPQLNSFNTNDFSAKVNGTFSYRGFSLEDVNFGEKDNKNNVRVIYRLIEPGSGRTEVSSVSGSAYVGDFVDKVKDGMFTPETEYKFTKSGNYTVELILEDNAGNQSIYRYTITVSTATGNTPTSLTMLSTILIIVGVLLIIGVIIYLIRFRKRRA